ncbi:bifunctional enoyl-CoA hydratase/phosphate acetyltransferase [Herbaspirillum sp. RTI4]|uniref:bifunctional enoyl-CoA hydratase/phosphate acetyltransferase n=1 Tax=Herbaspirillum sp. RTI4 TaxID=3048640 RepID=UPI002AB3709D|nr:bifunctional enoyl-CoA hydratase/phosphate acetyltransferase [Herbaspirillum sp. RTI4]MDY7578944.1 bifunctional enoyl-CoA hydratase/phosphate acetyltransferase [Herbaspirillum sp. RTI4]MEA9982033.1 bifunctional enoyl-CoA hydratase/phosphate acetyltransferase [Herbaspirillum sp. RTI4]
MADIVDLNIVRNRIFSEIAIGETAAIERTLNAKDIQLFAVLSEDVNPQHLDIDYANTTRFHGVIAHGMLGGTLISAVLGNHLPGPGTIYLSQTLSFLKPVRIGDTLSIRVTVTARDETSQQLTLACTCINQDDVTVISGEARVIAPTERIERPRTTLPDVRISAGAGGLLRLLDHVRPMGAIRMAVVHPCDALSLSAAIDAHVAGLIEPVLIAPQAKLLKIAQEANLDIAGLCVEDVPHSHAAAARGAELAASGQVAAIMKGSLHTDELMAAVVALPGLRTGRRISHCFVMQTPAYPRPFIITDAAINIAPTLEEKADIVRNAIDLAQAIGVAQPRVAILAAVETVNPRMPATIDAAALCKMADRGQITGGILDGPLAFDNAVSAAAARIKGIVSEVAGQADILVVPDLESGNMLAKQLEYLGDAASAGIVLGAAVPIVLTSRADSRESRIASCAIAVLLAHRSAGASHE